MTDWRFGGSWPYEPRYFDTGDGRMHYVDEGERAGLPVVMLHGNPTWSYLYRACIERLVGAGHRAIAIDHLGFGRSDVPESADVYTIDRHSARLGKLLGHLGLPHTVFVIHDWSGPIALPIVLADPSALSGLVLLNTFPPRLPAAIGSRRSLRALRGRFLGPVLVKRRNVPVEQFLFKAGTVKKHWDEQTKEAYRAPHPTPSSRVPMLAFPRQIPFADEDPVAIASQQTAGWIGQHLTRKPVRIIWGMQDVLFGKGILECWQQVLPNAHVSRVNSAGHFIQEDEPELTAKEIAAFASKLAERRRTT